MFSTLETGTGAWAGGLLEGYTDGKAIGPVPINLGIGAIALAVGHFNLATEKWSGHFINFGTGFLGSYFAAVGYKFGRSWKVSGKPWGGHSLSAPYAELPTAVHGDLSEAQMAAIVQRLQAAAAHG